MSNKRKKRSVEGKLSARDSRILEVKNEIDRIFSDTRVDKSETLEDLKDIREHLDMQIDSLEDR